MRLGAAVPPLVLALVLHGAVVGWTERLEAPPVGTGVYFGWAHANGTDGRFQLLADACVDPVAERHPLLEVALTNRDGTLLLEPPAVQVSRPDLVFGAPVTVYSFDPAAFADAPGSVRHDALPLRTVALDRLVVRCRDHAEVTIRLGSAAVMLLDAAPADALTVSQRRVPPATEALGILVISNDAEHPVTLRSLTYASGRASTGSVRGAAGEPAYLPLWLAEAYGSPQVPTATGPASPGGDGAARTTRPLAGTVDPASLTPWDAAYLDPDDPRALRERRADRLDLSMQPGDVAVIVVDQRALRRTLVQRPALLYPVIGYTLGLDSEPLDSTTTPAHIATLGLDTALYGHSPSWR